MTEKILLKDYDYELPPELIAQQPLPGRDDSRMMVLNRSLKTIEHRRFKEIANFFEPGEVLVLNNSRVIPARAWAVKRDGDGKSIEFLFIKEKKPGTWEVLCRPAKKVKEGDSLVFDSNLEARVTGRGPLGHRLLEFNTTEVLARLKEIGVAPLPPYIKRKKGDPRFKKIDAERYQTVYATRDGSIAAPTAGLHFTENILDELKQKGVDIQYVTLNVGLATFQPVRVEKITDHRMLEESFYISPETAGAINLARKEGRRITAVGTTVVRTLESAWTENGLQAGEHTTRLFIYPGYHFKVVERMLTNFHLPRSTLLMLVCAFAGYDLVMAAYREAVRERYRFFSYGDCMLIV
ncbi:MAG: S-adenosylmethionine:tRNA ribosyltransferase-isomerase [Candidatus Saccharicenans subterraneus]|uniref:S-adenosylmethionine:tRNA ribosyltransferase-isomerase n=1 Tax=Candidatus Saccharicenans subterraneus TaxID=2508984 RepID=A0A3E2BML6_9BACT|nr:MAG: S-adenosylmethionine:tRNA ribosyltransferase-isomerase [Candidatus Saccharicenans subterraneum]